MKRILINFTLLVGVIYTSTISASLVSLSHDFLKSNQDVLALRGNLLKSRFDRDAIFANRPWVIGINSSYINSNLSSTSNLVNDNTTLSDNLSFSKSFDWGGVFKFSNGLSEIESSSTGDKNYRFYQELSYSQDLGVDFFGRIRDMELAAATSSVNSESLKNKIAIDQLLLSFGGLYYATQGKVALWALSKNALKRAQKRVGVVKKKVKDGLKERVDLYFAQAEVLNGQELMTQAESEFRGSIKELEKLIHRKINPSEIAIVDYKNYANKEENQSGKFVNTFKKKELEVRLKLLKEKLLQANYKVAPAISLDTRYKSDSYTDSSGTSISDGTMGGENDELAIALTLSLPFSFESQKLARSKAKIDVKITQNYLKVSQKNFLRNEDILKIKISSLKKNIDTAIKRRVLSVKSLREYNKLYSLGRADLDQVIRAEESLIKTEITLVSYIVNKESLRLSIGFLYGDLQSLLKLNE